MSFEHLLNLSDEIGLFQHADHAQPRRYQGYRTTDMARLLVLVTRHPTPSRAVTDLGRTAMRFLSDAQAPDGRVRDQRTSLGAWEGEAGVGDGWGQSMWAWGTVVRSGPDARVRRQATACFKRGAGQRSESPRAMAFAALGAAEVLRARPHNADARALLTDVADSVGPVHDDADWPWPEARLGYANAAVCDVLLSAGDLLDRPELTAAGLTLLEWLLARETVDGHLSPTPAGGAGPSDRAPGFPQRPLEVATMAEACARALLITGEQRWRDGIELACGWFTGRNDLSAPMWDPETDGSYDGLLATGPDRNQGAASILALLSTFQHGRSTAAPSARPARR